MVVKLFRAHWFVQVAHVVKGELEVNIKRLFHGERRGKRVFPFFLTCYDGEIVLAACPSFQITAISFSHASESVQLICVKPLQAPFSRLQDVQTCQICCRSRICPLLWEGVNRELTEKLSVDASPVKRRIKVLKDIAQEHNFGL